MLSQACSPFNSGQLDCILSANFSSGMSLFSRFCIASVVLFTNKPKEEESHSWGFNAQAQFLLHSFCFPAAMQWVNKCYADLILDYVGTVKESPVETLLESFFKNSFLWHFYNNQGVNPKWSGQILQHDQFHSVDTSSSSDFGCVSVLLILFHWWMRYPVKFLLQVILRAI